MTRHDAPTLKEKETLGINTMWQHALELKADRLQKDLPGVVNHDIEWLQRQLNSRQRWPMGSMGQLCPWHGGYTLTRNMNWISWAWIVRQQANELTKAEALLPQTETFGMYTHHHWQEVRVRHVTTKDTSQILCCKFSVLLWTQRLWAELQDDLPRCLSPW